MTEILQANIFFFIASGATIIFTIMLCIAMYLVIKILASIRAILARVEAGSDMIADDIQAARDFVAGGGLIAHLIGFVTRASGGSARRSSKAKKELIIKDSK